MFITAFVLLKMIFVYYFLSFEQEIVISIFFSWFQTPEVTNIVLCNDFLPHNIEHQILLL